MENLIHEQKGWKSKRIGQTVNGFIILDNHRKGNRTLYVVECIKCGTKQEKDSTTIMRNQARCKCSYKQTHHGKAGSKIYNVYQRMKQRCYNPKDAYYHRYGARGITVCDRWKDSFTNFYEDVSKLPHYGEKGYSLDRINNDGDYEPDNVRWGTLKNQSNNTSRNRIVSYKGETMTLKQCSEILGVNYNTVNTRLRRGQSISEAFKNIEVKAL